MRPLTKADQRSRRVYLFVKNVQGGNTASSSKTGDKQWGRENEEESGKLDIQTLLTPEYHVYSAIRREKTYHAGSQGGGRKKGPNLRS